MRDWLRQSMKMDFKGTQQENLVGLCQGDMESFGLSCEDAQDMDHWRLKIQNWEETG